MAFDGPSKGRYWRVLGPDENVWKSQSKWTTAGRFKLAKKEDIANYEKVK